MSGRDITECWVFVTVTPEGDETVAVFHNGTMWMPMIATDMARVHHLRTIARDVASASGQKIEIRHFTMVDDVEDVVPRT